MAAICPNINTPEWKTMIKHVGEREAYRAYMANNYTFPTVVSMTNLKKQLGLTGGPYSPMQQININNKIRNFNQKHGTSHRVNYVPFGANSFRAELVFSYLPVNKEAQTERIEKQITDRYIPSESEIEAGRFVDGDFVPPSYMPSPKKEKEVTKFEEYIKVKRNELQSLYKQKDELKILQRKTEDEADRHKVRIRLQRVRRNIENVEEKILELSNLERLSDIEVYAEEDMATLERIFTQPSVLPADLIAADNIIKMWQAAGDFSGNNPHPFYDPEEFEVRTEGLKHITEKFEEWSKRADEYNVRLVKLREDIVKGEVALTFPGSEIDFENPIKDVNLLVKNFMDVSETEHVLLQAMATWVKDVNWASQRELQDIFNNLDKLIDATGLTNFDIFQQTFSNDDSRKTGEMVHRFSQSFFTWESNINRIRKRANEAAAKKEGTADKVRIRTEANKRFIDELRKNTVIFDARILFYDPELRELEGVPKPTDEQIAAHEADLRELLGDNGYEVYHESNRKKIEEYKAALDAERSLMETKFAGNGAEIERQVDAWVAQNSPYVYAEVMEKGYDKVKHNGLHVYPTNRYVRPIPKKTVNGEDTGFYDTKFQQIEQNDSYRELYDYMFEMLQELKLYLPNEKVNFMHINSIPTIRKKVLENMTGTDGSLSKTFSRSKEALFEATKDTDMNDATPEERKEHQFHMLQNNRKRINDYIDLQTIGYVNDNKKEPSAEMKEEWRRNIMDEIASEKSFDLGRVMKAFASLSVTYKHRASIEDQMRLSQQIIENGIKNKREGKGEPIAEQGSNKNIIGMVDDFMDVAYWGYPTDNTRGLKGDKKILSKKEKKLKTVLDQRLTEINEMMKGEEDLVKLGELQTRKDVVKDQLESLGSVRSYSKYGDSLLKYIQIKGMGWNVYAAFANMGFGFISNIIEGSDGRNYSMKTLWKSYALAMNSVGKNFTFNTWDGLNENAKKIRVLMDYYDTLKEAKNEIYKPTSKTLFKKINGKLEWTNPYAPQSRSEYFNQAPVMIAMLMETKVKTKDGKEISLWDAYNVDGTIKEGVEFEAGSKLDFRVKGQIDKLVKMNHGNYDPDTPLSIKRKVYGRALSQFRTWMFQGFAERFKKEIKDYQLTNRLTGEDFVMRKGRYRSYISYFKEMNGVMGTGSPIHMLTQLAGKLVGINTKFDKMVSNNFTETDAANMRKNMTELAMYIMLSTLALILKAAVDDEDDPRKKFGYYFLINQGARLNTDIWFYTNPIEFERLTRNAIPAFSLIVDGAKFLDSAATLLTGGEDILQSGPNKGKSRTWRDFKKLIPGATQIQKVQSAGSQVYKK